MEERFYFESGMTFHAACAGNEIRNLRMIQQTFAVTLVARDGCVEIAGEDRDVARCKEFFIELARFFAVRNRKLDQRDFELICKAFRDNCAGDLADLWRERIRVSPKKNEVLPRSRRQMEYIRQIRDKDVVFGIGPAGTGKTYLAMALAVSEFLAGNCNRIILTRPARESGEHLGFLPGNLEEKIMPYLRPLYDALYDMLPVEEAAALIERGAIEVAPLAFMRGRTLSEAFIILDEAQNTTPEQMKMFLTRLGFNSRAVITGDITQIDLPGDRKSGLKEARKILSEVEGVAFVELTRRDVVRNALVQRIIKAYEHENSKGG